MSCSKYTASHGFVVASSCLLAVRSSIQFLQVGWIDRIDRYPSGHFLFPGRSLSCLPFLESPSTCLSCHHGWFSLGGKILLLTFYLLLSIINFLIIYVSVHILSSILTWLFLVSSWISNRHSSISSIVIMWHHKQLHLTQY